MRPRGEIRLALGEAAWQVARERADGGTFRELAQRACVGFSSARKTLENMASAGELLVTGKARVPGAARPANRYAPAEALAQHRTTRAELATVMRSWTVAR